VSIILLAAIGGLLAIDVNQVDARQDGTVTALTDGNTKGGTTEFPMSAPIGAVIKMVSALVVVVICIYGGIYLLKRMMYGRNRHKSREALLEVIESAHVGPKKTISLVRVADRSVLIGVTENQISVLTELDADETAVIIARESEVEENTGFGHVFGVAADKLRRLAVSKNPTAQEG
jgi:flagellar protein FliO/FliZ